MTTGCSRVLTPRASARLDSPQMPEWLVPVRRELLAQRAFRVQQLKALDARVPEELEDVALSEVHHALRLAARLVLDDIDRALVRIDRGSYGRCERCLDAIPLERLRAVPMTPWCGHCREQVSHTCVRWGADPPVQPAIPAPPCSRSHGGGAGSSRFVS